jgi:TonB family protein
MTIRRCIFTLSASIFIAFGAAAVRADECPVRVSSVDLEGKGISDHVYRYRIVLHPTSGGSQPDVGLRVQVAGGRSPVHTVASHLILNTDKDAHDDVLIFERPKPDAMDVAVVDTESGDIINPCSSSSVRVGEAITGLAEADIPTVLVTLDDSKRVAPDATRADLLSGTSHESTFKSRGHLDYPQEAEENDVVGAVRAKIQIDPGGQIEHAQIAVSSGSKLLDGAALKALGRTTFNGSTSDGIPVANDYGVIYEFEIDNGVDHGVQPAPVDVLKNCPAALTGISLATKLFGGTAYWYDVGLDTTLSPIDSLTLAVVGAHAPVKLVPWSAIPMGVAQALTRDNVAKPWGFVDDQVDAGRPTTEVASHEGALFWTGDPLAAGTVQDATPLAKPAVTCQPYGAKVGYDVDTDAIVGNSDTDRPWLNSPILESVLPAHFAMIAWPKFVPSSSDPATAVEIGVRVHVTQSGVPLVAILHSASIAPGFAAAVLAAAMASTYVVPLSPGGAPLTQTFDVKYVYVPAN